MKLYDFTRNGAQSLVVKDEARMLIRSCGKVIEEAHPKAAIRKDECSGRICKLRNADHYRRKADGLMLSSRNNKVLRSSETFTLSDRYLGLDK